MGVKSASQAIIVFAHFNEETNKLAPPVPSPTSFRLDALTTFGSVTLALRVSSEDPWNFLIVHTTFQSVSFRFVSCGFVWFRFISEGGGG